MSDPSATTVPDQATVDVAVGGRVLVVSDLRLGPAQTAAAAELVSAIEAWSGPGALVFNGNLVTVPAGAGKRTVNALRAAWTAHPRLVEAARAFASGPGRRVLVLPGATDACLAWHDPAREEVARQLGAEVALSATLRIETGSGTQVVQVEPGHRLDPLAAFGDPRNPGESPLAQHLRNDVLPAAAHRPDSRWPDSKWRSSRRRASWLEGAEQLDDPAAFPRFVASRLTYRRLARAAWLLLLPIIGGIVLRAPALALARTRGLTHSGARTALLVGASAVELIVLAAIIVASIRGTWRALSALSLGVDRRDPNEAPRALARDLVTAGSHIGLITGHTCRPELTHLGAGFYANAGCATEVVAEVAGRLPGLGLPPVFLGSPPDRLGRAGSRQRPARPAAPRPLGPARAPTSLERLMARPGRGRDRDPGEARPEVVATFPQGRIVAAGSQRPAPSPPGPARGRRRSSPSPASSPSSRRCPIRCADRLGRSCGTCSPSPCPRPPPP